MITVFPALTEWRQSDSEYWSSDEYIDLKWLIQLKLKACTVVQFVVSLFIVSLGGSMSLAKASKELQWTRVNPYIIFPLLVLSSLLLSDRALTKNMKFGAQQHFCGNILDGHKKDSSTFTSLSSCIEASVDPSPSGHSWKAVVDTIYELGHYEAHKPMCPSQEMEDFVLQLPHCTKYFQPFPSSQRIHKPELWFAVCAFMWAHTARGNAAKLNFPVPWKWTY